MDANLRCGGKRRSGPGSGLRCTHRGRPPLGTRGGVLRGARQRVGRQYRRRTDGLGVGVHRAVPGLLRRPSRLQQLGRHRAARGVQRPRPGVVQRSHLADIGHRPDALRQAGGRSIRHQRRRGPGLPPGGGPDRGLLGTDHGDAPGQRDHPGVVVRRRAGDRRPMRRGPSRKRAPIADASIKPGCAKTCCCRPRSASLATPAPRSMCWPGRCRTRWASSRWNWVPATRAALQAGICRGDLEDEVVAAIVRVAAPTMALGDATVGPGGIVI